MRLESVEGTKCSLFLLIRIDIEQKLKELVDEYCTGTLDNAFFLVDLVVKNNKKIQVFIDGENPVSFELCRKLSRHLETQMDEHQWFGTDYVLEVSSPGAERPLKDVRQFKKHIGRKGEFTLEDGSKLKGELHAMDETSMTIVDKLKKSTIEINRIEEIKIIISF